MELRSAAEVVLRVQHSVFCSFRPNSHTRGHAFLRFPVASKREFSSRSFQYAQDVSKKAPGSSSDEQSRMTEDAKSTSGFSSESKEHITGRIQDLLQKNMASGPRSGFLSSSGTPHYKSPSAQSEARSGKSSQGLSLEMSEPESQTSGHEFSPIPANLSSADMVRQGFAAATKWPSDYRDERRRTGKLDVNFLSTPMVASSPPPPLIYRHATPQEPTIKLGPTVGRTVELDPARGVDLARGFGMLNMLCARNKVSLESRRQRFHERPGLKRKRLKSERWRKRFKLGFQAVIRRVEKLKKQGW